MARIRSIHPGLVPASRSSNVRYLYVIGEEGSTNLVKIGRADHPVWRMSSLQAGNSRRLFLIATWTGDKASIAALESEIHKRFSDHRVGFEWFNLSPGAVAEFIEEWSQ
jgi:hypothetical protein